MNPILAIFLLQGEVAASPHLVVTDNTRYWVIVGGAVLAVAVLIGIWILLALRPKHKHSRHRHRHHRGDEVEIGTNGKDAQRPHRRRRHRNSDDSLPRNPTLAETGGLPPLRDERTRPGQRP